MNIYTYTINHFFQPPQLLHHMIFTTRLVGWCLALSNSPPEVQPHPTSSRFLQMASSSSQLPKCNVKCSTQRCNALPGKPWSKTWKKSNWRPRRCSRRNPRSIWETLFLYRWPLDFFPPPKKTEHMKCRWRMESMEDRTTYTFRFLLVITLPKA